MFSSHSCSSPLRKIKVEPVGQAFQTGEAPAMGFDVQAGLLPPKLGDSLTEMLDPGGQFSIPRSPFTPTIQDWPPSGAAVHLTSPGADVVALEDCARAAIEVDSNKATITTANTATEMIRLTGRFLFISDPLLVDCAKHNSDLTVSLQYNPTQPGYKRKLIENRRYFLWLPLT
jgi:hypothetical protein